MAATNFDDSGDGGFPMPRRRSNKKSVPNLPLRIQAVVRNRVIAELKFGDDPNLIVPGSVMLVADPSGVSGPDREAAVWDIVRKAKLDIKLDFERIYDCLWTNVPKPL